MAVTIEQLKESYRKQLQAEVDAALKRYESQRKSDLAEKINSADAEQQRLRREFAAYETQTMAQLVADIQSMTEAYQQDALRRGMTRSSYALERNAAGEAALRSQSTYNIAQAQADMQARNDELNARKLQYNAQYADDIAAERAARESSMTAKLQAWELDKLEEQAKAEAEAAAAAAKRKTYTAAPKVEEEPKTTEPEQTEKKLRLNVAKLTELYRRENSYW